MALSVKVGTFNLNTTTGSQSVTGVGFEPVALIIYWTAQTSDDNSTANAFSSIGAATSSTDEWGEACIAQHNQTTTQTVSRRGTTFLFGIDTAGTINVQGSFTSFDADGFTFNITTSNAQAYRIGYIALGGADITGAKATRVTQTAGTGTEAFTGTGFQPTLLMVVKGNNSNSDLAIAGAFRSIGWANAMQQASISVTSQDNVADSNTHGILRSDRLVSHINATGTLISASLDSFDADGFTLDRHESTAANATLSYLALAGTFSSAIGVDTQKTTTGTKSTIGIGVLPKVVFFGSAHRASSSSVTAEAFQSTGAADGTSQNVAGRTDHDALGSSQGGKTYSTAKVLRHITVEAGAGPTITTVSEADVDSLDGNGFTLDWTTADATAREFFYMAMGAAVTSSWEPYARKPAFLPPEPEADVPFRDSAFLLQAPAWVPSLKRQRDEAAFLDDLYHAKTKEEVTRRTVGFIFPSFEGVAKYWVGLATLAGSLYKYRLAFHNLQASTDPGTGDDEGDNYAPGSIWVNKATDEAFICLSAVSGAAVWWSITALDGGAP
jgi:hypothetical protein